MDGTKIERQKRIEAEEKLREAVSIGNEDAVKWLLQCGVDVNSQNKVNGWSALHWAVKRSHANIIKLLLENGAKPDLKNNDGIIPLQLTSDQLAIKLLGGNSQDTTVKDCNILSSTTFLPNYLKNPVFPYTNERDSRTLNAPEGTDKQSSATPTTGFLFQPKAPLLVNNSKWTPCGLLVVPGQLVIKARVASEANSDDFIEVCVDRQSTLTYHHLKNILCEELLMKEERNNIKFIRKLPDTILRSDSDVRRLTDYQMLEVVFNREEDRFVVP